MFPDSCFSPISEGGTIPRAIDEILGHGKDHQEYYDSVAFRWKMVVLDYSRRKLTKPGDKLPAISGLAALFGQLINDKYIAGIWWGDLIRQMLWHAENNEWLKPALVEYRAPTWSWASVDGALTFFWELESRIITGTPAIIDARVTGLASGSYGAISNGHIRIRGLLGAINYSNNCPPRMPGDVVYVKDWSYRNHFAIVYLDDNCCENRIGAYLSIKSYYQTS